MGSEGVLGAGGPVQAGERGVAGEPQPGHRPGDRQPGQPRPRQVQAVLRGQEQRQSGQLGQYTVDTSASKSCIRVPSEGS